MEYRESQEFVGDITKELAPQIQGGNQAVTSSLAQALNAIDPQLSAFVVEGLKSPATTQYAVNALLERLNDTSAFQMMNQVAPLLNNASYYAFKNPSTESDPSLIAPQKITETARSAPHPMATASALLEQGEVASAEMVKRLTDYGAKTQADIEKGLANFKTALQSLDQVEIQSQQRGDHVAIMMTHPAMPNMPLMTGIGRLDETGTWTPEIQGFGVGTPAQERMMAILQKENVTAALSQEYGIQAFAPKFKTLAPPPTTPLRPRQPSARIEELEADPRFQALSPEGQRVARERFFEKYVATKPAAARVIAQDPAQLQPMKEAHEGWLVKRAAAMAPGALTGEDPYAAMAAAEGLGGATAVAQVGAAALGAQPHILTAEQEQNIRGVVGERPVAEVAGATIAAGAVGMTPLGMIAGPAAYGALSAVNQAAQQDMPVYLSASDTLFGSNPLGGREPGSQLSAGAEAALQNALIAKVAPIAIGIPVATAVGAAKGAAWAGRKIAGRTPEGVKELVRDATGALGRLVKTGAPSKQDYSTLEQLAASQNTTINYQIANKILEHTPAVKITNRGALKITLKDGRLLDSTNFPKGLTDELDKIGADPTYMPKFGEYADLAPIAAIEGKITDVNNFFRALKADLEVVPATIATGARITKVKNEWLVILPDKNPIPFKTRAQAQDYVNKLPVGNQTIESQAFKYVLAEGLNPYYLTSRVTNRDAWRGDLLPVPTWGTFVNWATGGIQPPAQRMMRLEQSGGYPLYSQVYVPLQKFMTLHHKYTAPKFENIKAILKDAKLGKITDPKREGYAHLVSTKPGTKEWDDVVAEYKLDPAIGERMRQHILDVGNDLGFDGDKLLTEILPRVRTYALPDRAYPGKSKPKELSWFAEEVNLGTMPWNDTAPDIESWLLATTTQASMYKHVMPAWNHMLKVADDLLAKIETNTTLSLEARVMERREAYATLEHYFRSVRGWGDDWDERMMAGFGMFMQKLSVGSKVPPADVTRLGKQVWGAFYAASYRAYFGHRPSAAIKQFTQVVQVTGSYFGNLATFNGMRALHGKGRDAIWQLIKDADGLLDVQPYHEAGLGKIGEWLQKGGNWMQRADNLMRGYTGSTMHLLFREAAPTYQATAPKVAPRGPMPAAPLPPVGPYLVGPQPFVGPPRPPAAAPTPAPPTPPVSLPPGSTTAFGNLSPDVVARIQARRAAALQPTPAKPPPTIASTTSQRMPKNYGLVSPQFQKQFPMGTEVTFEAMGPSGTRPAQGTVTGYIRTKSGVEHVTVAEPGVPEGHVANVASGLRRVGGPGTKPGPKGPRTLPTGPLPRGQEPGTSLPPPRPAPPGFEKFVEESRRLRQPVKPGKRVLSVAEEAAEDAGVPLPIGVAPPVPPPPTPPPPSVGPSHSSKGLFGEAWEKFARATSISKFTDLEQLEIKGLMDAGDIAAAEKLAIRKAIQHTQFLYDLPNRPSALTGIIGKFYGQFGVYPLNMIENMRQMLTRGQDWQESAAWIGRWTANNAALKGTAAVLLGADMANYTFFSPLAFTGGPWFSWWQDVGDALGGGPWADQARARLLGNMVKGVVPEAGVFTDVVDVMREMGKGDLQGAAREALSLPKAR